AGTLVQCRPAYGGHHGQGSGVRRVRGRGRLLRHHGTWFWLGRTGPATSGQPRSPFRAYADETWSYATGGPVESSPAVVARTLHIGSDDGYVYALNATTGAKVLSYHTGGAVRCSPTGIEVSGAG